LCASHSVVSQSLLCASHFVVRQPLCCVPVTLSCDAQYRGFQWQIEIRNDSIGGIRNFLLILVVRLGLLSYSTLPCSITKVTSLLLTLTPNFDTPISKLTLFNTFHFTFVSSSLILFCHPGLYRVYLKPFAEIRKSLSNCLILNDEDLNTR
jgi:hypothetical protein